MKKLLVFSIVALLVMSALASEAISWRREYRNRQREHYQSYIIKNPDGLKNCQATCQKKYGIDAAKCKEMDTAAKKTCRQNNRSCNTKCWNKYH